MVKVDDSNPPQEQHHRHDPPSSPRLEAQIRRLGYSRACQLSPLPPATLSPLARTASSEGCSAVRFVGTNCPRSNRYLAHGGRSGIKRASSAEVPLPQLRTCGLIAASPRLAERNSIAAQRSMRTERSGAANASTANPPPSESPRDAWTSTSPPLQNPHPTNSHSLTISSFKRFNRLYARTSSFLSQRHSHFAEASETPKGQKRGKSGGRCKITLMPATRLLGVRDGGGDNAMLHA